MGVHNGRFHKHMAALPHSHEVKVTSCTHLPPSQTQALEREGSGMLESIQEAQDHADRDAAHLP